MTKLRQTPSQTVGPYFAYGLSPEQYGYQQNLTSIAGSQMAEGDVEGERIRVEGRVFDGAGNPISDALIEIWQADATGPLRSSGGPARQQQHVQGIWPLRHRDGPADIGIGSTRSSRARSAPIRHRT